MLEHTVFNNVLMARAILAAHSDVIVASDREWVIRFWSPGVVSDGLAVILWKPPNRAR